IRDFHVTGVQTCALPICLYHSRQSGQNTFGANAELLLTGRYGLLSNTALFNSRAQAGFDNTVRLDTRWQYIDPVNVRSYVVGDRSEERRVGKECRGRGAP